MRKLLWLAALFAGASVLRAETVVDWELSPTDKSYQYLAFLFGNVSDDLVCYTQGCSQVIPLIFQAFNQSLLILASMLLGYISLISTGSSAQQGEFLGRRYSSLWTPVKLIGGMSFIVPTGSGYCLLQVSIMKITLMGVALANNLYGVIENYVTRNNVSFAMESQNTNARMQYDDLLAFSEKVYPYELCYAYYQRASYMYEINPAEATNLGLPDEDSTFYKGPQEFACPGVLWGYNYNNDSKDMICDCSANQPLIPPSPNTCGYWTYRFSSNDPDPNMTQETLGVLLSNIRLISQQDISFFLDSGVMDSYLKGEDMSTAQQQMVQTQATLSITQLAQSIAIASTQLISQSLGTVTSEQVSYAKGSDWLNFLDNFYVWLNKTGSAGAVDFIGITEASPGAALSSSDTEQQKAFYATRSSLADQNYFDLESIENVLGGSTSSEYGLKKPSGTGSAIDGSPADKAFSMFKQMLSKARDPLISLAIFGQRLLQLSFDMLFSSVIIAAILMIVTAICSSKNSTFSVGIVTALGAFIVNVMLIFGFLIPIGVLLGIYLPTMPLMLYTFGAVHWFISVVEAMVAGPIIALGFMAPTQQQDLLGKSSPAVLMLLQVFIRPAGMVLGMVFGAKLFDVIAAYFTQSFVVGLAFLQGFMSGVNPIRVLLYVIYFFFYSFVIVGIANRCYSLINALPDRLISWIGGATGQVSHEVEEDMGVYRQAVDRGGQDIKENMSSLAQGLGSSMKSINSILQKENKNTNDAVPPPAPPPSGGGGSGPSATVSSGAPSASSGGGGPSATISQAPPTSTASTGTAPTASASSISNTSAASTAASMAAPSLPGSDQNTPANATTSSTEGSSGSRVLAPNTENSGGLNISVTSDTGNVAPPEGADEESPPRQE